MVTKVDVLVVGGGPVGLVTAYQLTRFGGVSVHIIEKHAKSNQDQYGRAITLFPRSTEMLEQIGLAEELAQQCFANRASVTYNKDGQAVQGRGWSFMENMKDTQWDFALVLRQKYQEEIFRQALKRNGVSLHTPAELTGIQVDEKVPQGDYRVTAKILNRSSGEETVVKCKYLIGADGGRSFVRNAAKIPFDGDTTEDKWVRVDGVVETNMPNPRSYGSIESPTHGNVLWAALDHGATRIGYAFTPERQAGYKEFNEEAAVKEAIASVAPFELKFKQVDWYTVYSVGQRVARKFFVQGCIFLAGDACHTHSSGAAQGMNTGMHDSVNLAWKLSLVLRGKASPALLETYESERQPNVQKLIDYDKDVATLMTMRLPKSWTGPQDADPNEVLGKVFEEISGFNTGLGIGFTENTLNTTGSFPSGVLPGQRGPDVKLQSPGTLEPTRLHVVTPNFGRFWIVVFAGNPLLTGKKLQALKDAVSASSFFSSSESSSATVDTEDESLPANWLTIPAVSGPSAIELLGILPFGRVYFDNEQTAHARYGIDTAKGAVVVIRPDGWVATTMALEAKAVNELEAYFKRFLL